jgi:hypothetical protein
MYVLVRQIYDDIQFIAVSESRQALERCLQYRAAADARCYGTSANVPDWTVYYSIHQTPYAPILLPPEDACVKEFPKGYMPCTRRKDHEGPCAHPSYWGQPSHKSADEIGDLLDEAEDIIRTNLPGYTVFLDRVKALREGK